MNTSDQMILSILLSIVLLSSAKRASTERAAAAIRCSATQRRASAYLAECSVFDRALRAERVWYWLTAAAGLVSLLLSARDGISRVALCAQTDGLGAAVDVPPSSVACAFAAAAVVYRAALRACAAHYASDEHCARAQSNGFDPLAAAAIEALIEHSELSVSVRGTADTILDETRATAVRRMETH